MNRKQEVDLELKKARKKSAKPMLWISLISMVMFFAGLTSAYVISRKREDWVAFDLPDAFYTSTALIIASSISLFLSWQFLKREQRSLSIITLAITLVLGIAFVWYQYIGFEQLKSAGLYFTGKGSTVSTSFLLGITLMHILHLAAGIIVLIIVLSNHLRNKYTSKNTLGFELGAIFWHFVDVLWIYLFFFFYFIR